MNYVRVFLTVQIQSHEDVYTWINQTLMPNLYSSDWYNGQPLTTWREALQTRDRATIRLGIARVRQMRIKDGLFTSVSSGYSRRSRYNYRSTSIRRPFDCISKVI